MLAEFASHDNLGQKGMEHQAAPWNLHHGMACCKGVEFINVEPLTEFASQDSPARTNMEVWVVPRNSHRETTHGGGEGPVRTKLLAEFASQNDLFLRNNEIGGGGSSWNSHGDRPPNY